MPSPAIYSKTTLFVATSSATQPTAILGITNIGGPNFTRPEIDITNMESNVLSFIF